MVIKTAPHDAADFLTDEETISAYLTEVLEGDDPRYIAKALGAIARARGGMAQLARETGIAREALYRALSDTGNPELGTALKVMHAPGVRLTASITA
jgi:probable addiction module antidote protein